MDAKRMLPVRAGAMRRLAKLTYLAWRNLWRNPVRSLLTSGAMVAGLTLMIAALALMEGLFREMVGYATNVSIGRLQIHRQAYIDDQDLYAVLPWDLVRYLREHTDYSYAPRLYAAGLAGAGDFSSGALLRGIDPVAESRVTTLAQRVRKGSFDLETTTQAYPRGKTAGAVTVYPVLLGKSLAKTLRVGVGDEIVLITQAADGSIGNGLFRVRGVMAPIDPAFDRMGVLLSIKGFNSLMYLDSGVHELAVGTPAGVPPEQAQTRIEQVVADWPGLSALNDGAGSVRVRTWKQINPVLANMISANQVVMYVIAVIIFSIAAMGMLNTMLMAVYERRHELGILLALGMGRGSLMLMVLAEAFFLSCFAAALGSVTGIALSWYLQVAGIDFSRWLPEGLDFMGVVVDPVYRAYLLPQHVWISVVLAVLTTLVAALVPSWRTARLEPVRVLHQ